MLEGSSASTPGGWISFEPEAAKERGPVDIQCEKRPLLYQTPEIVARALLNSRSTVPFRTESVIGPIERAHSASFAPKV